MKTTLFVVLIASILPGIADAMTRGKKLQKGITDSQYVDHILSRYKFEEELTIIPGEVVPYKHHKMGFKGQYRIKDLYIDQRNTTPDKIHSVFSEFKAAAEIDEILDETGDEEMISISLLLPSIVSERTNTYSSFYGPNCFNAVLAFRNPDLGMEYQSKEETVPLLSRKYRRLGRSDTPRLGDTIAIYSGPDLIHAAIYLNRSYVWHKGSYFIEDPWTFETFESAVHVYVRDFLDSIRVEIYRFNTIDRT